uniref:Retrotransposon protein, putative, unclassified n=1 Tax=Oryza sativa subsp. japonica TaxID=39947 RepID=Q2QT76_ORYSJ|nr:retrotransposon protein, putative, unclassified [Oryza sativa Japonica Group]
MTLRWLVASRGRLPCLLLSLRCQRRRQRGSATTESTAKLRRRSKHGDGSAFTVMTTSGGVQGKRTGGRDRALHYKAEGGDGADRGRPERRRDSAGVGGRRWREWLAWGEAAGARRLRKKRGNGRGGRASAIYSQRRRSAWIREG